MVSESEECFIMRSHVKKRRRGDSEEVLASIPTTPEGCKIAGGVWNPKSKQCDIRQEHFEGDPGHLVKPFDRVLRADEVDTTKKPDESE